MFVAAIFFILGFFSFPFIFYLLLEFIAWYKKEI
jgi:hypothetical protein